MLPPNRLYKTGMWPRPPSGERSIRVKSIWQTSLAPLIRTKTTLQVSVRRPQMELVVLDSGAARADVVVLRAAAPAGGSLRHSALPVVPEVLVAPAVAQVDVAEVLRSGDSAGKMRIRLPSM